MAYFITDRCVDILDQSCVRECPVDCIYQGDRSMYINPEECIDCGACEVVCPVEAVNYEPELAPEDRPAVERTHQWIATHGAAGGARRVGRVGVDHPDIAAMPPQTRQDV